MKDYSQHIIGSQLQTDTDVQKNMLQLKPTEIVIVKP